jgi:hypothetical protein
MLYHGAAYSSSARRRSRVHRFYFAMNFGELFQRAYRYERIAIPRRPKNDIGRFQPSKI